jgi:hypothetical protein
LGDVASGERDFVSPREGEKAFEEFIGPTLVEVTGQGE